MDNGTEESVILATESTTLHLVKALREDFHEWRHGNALENQRIQNRISQLEDKALNIPSAKESELIKEAAAYYKAKREFRERLVERFTEKGVTGLVLFLGASAFFYLKHLMTNGP